MNISAILNTDNMYFNICCILYISYLHNKLPTIILSFIFAQTMTPLLMSLTAKLSMVFFYAALLKENK